mmetsp:Transcript_85214/g.241447  ORF Transcript_85214/g.241447 Transcript_85214/m.241447 type:complete len:223 (+) Transcript_85214:1088-1756(+)
MPRPQRRPRRTPSMVVRTSSVSTRCSSSCASSASARAWRRPTTRRSRRPSSATMRPAPERSVLPTRSRRWAGPATPATRRPRSGSPPGWTLTARAWTSRTSGSWSGSSARMRSAGWRRRSGATRTSPAPGSRPHKPAGSCRLCTCTATSRRPTWASPRRARRPAAWTSGASFWLASRTSRACAWASGRTAATTPRRWPGCGSSSCSTTRTTAGRCPFRSSCP